MFITLQISFGRLGGTATYCMAELFGKSRVVMVCCSHPLRAKLPLTSGTGVLVAMSVDHSPPHKPLPAEAWSMFQIADVDSGVIRWVNGDLVTHVLPG